MQTPSFQAAVAIIVTLVAVYWMLDVIAWRQMARRFARLEELEEFFACHEGCDGGQWAEELADDLKRRLDRAHDLMRSGDVKNARHEIERAMEDLEEVA